jgi:hypothetical protein
MPEEKSRHHRIVFVISGPALGDATDTTTVIMGIPRDAWEYMKDGKTHHFDISRFGVPCKIVLFGGDTFESVVKDLEDVNKARGFGPLRKRFEEDFGIKIEDDDADEG